MPPGNERRTDAGGVYYTPTCIVDYTVKNTVGKPLERKTPKETSIGRLVRRAQDWPYSSLFTGQRPQRAR